MNIASFIRHIITGLAGIGGALFLKGLITADQVDQVNQAGANLIDPLSIIFGTLLAGASRWVITIFSNLFGVGSGERQGNVTGPLMTVLVWVGTAAGLMGLPSCSPATTAALKSVPIQACYTDAHGNRVCYSTATGVSAEVDRRSGK